MSSLRLTYGIFIMLIFSMQPMFSQQAQLRLESDSLSYYIGDAAKIYLKLEGIGPKQMEFPEAISLPEGMELLESSGKNEKRIWKITAFQPGTYTIPGIEAGYVKTDKDSASAFSNNLELEFRAYPLDPDQDLRPPILPLKNAASGITKWLYYGAGGLVLLSILAFILLKKKNKFRMVVRDPFESIENLKAKLREESDPKENYALMSLIIRRYLEFRYEFAAPEMVTGQIMKKMDEKSVQKEDQKRFGDILREADKIKYAGWIADEKQLEADKKWILNRIKKDGRREADTE